MNLDLVKARLSAMDMMQDRIRQFIRTMGVHHDDSVLLSNISFQMSAHGIDYMFAYLQITDAANSLGVSAHDLSKAFQAVNMTEPIGAYKYTGNTPDMLIDSGKFHMTLMFTLAKAEEAKTDGADNNQM